MKIRWHARAVLLWLAGAASASCGSGGPADDGVQPCPEACPPVEPRLEGSWSSAAALQAPRREMPAALLEGRLYVAGGFGDDRRVLATVEAYDPQADAWSSAPALPEPRHHHGATVLDGKLYVVGGYSTLGESWRTERTLFEFDPARGSWRARAPLPQARGAMAVASAAGRLYVFGGAAEGREWNHTYVYDPAADAWSEGAPMPTAREHLAAATVGSTIYVSGGRTLSGNNFGVLEAYSPESDTWRTRSSMLMPRSGHGIAAMQGKLYVFGGEDLGRGAVLDHVEEYDPERDAWRRLAGLPGPLTGAGAAAIGSTIHVVGGSDPSGSTQRANLRFRLP